MRTFFVIPLAVAMLFTATACSAGDSGSERRSDAVVEEVDEMTEAAAVDVEDTVDKAFHELDGEEGASKTTVSRQRQTDGALITEVTADHRDSASGTAAIGTTAGAKPARATTGQTATATARTQSAAATPTPESRATARPATATAPTAAATPRPAATATPVPDATPKPTTTATPAPAPTATPHTHTWVASTHEEQVFDHYEDGAPIYESQRTWVGTDLICTQCGAHFGGNLEALFSHFDVSGHWASTDEDVYEYQDVFVGYEQVPIYRTEVVTDYEYCSECGATR